MAQDYPNIMVGYDFENPDEEAIKEKLENSDGSGTDFMNLQDVGDIDTVPPESVVNDAQMALDWKEETGNPNDCGTQVGWERANQIVNGESLSEDTINRMVSYFSRHEKGGDSQPKEDCSRMMWKAWGGDDGKEWAESKQEEFENAREAQAGLGIDMAELPEWERCMLEAWESTVATEDTDRQLLQTSTEVPDFVQNRIRDSIMDGNVFSDIDSISGDMMQLRNYLTESLTSDGGWTIDGVADQLMQLDGVDTRDKAEVIARTETASILNSARESGYKEQGLEDSNFYWTNPLTDRTTQACEWLTKKTNPFKGGDPVSLEKLKELIEEAPEHDDEMQDDLARPENFVIHPNERSSWVRMPGT